MKFRLLAGKHVEGGRRYVKGDVIDSRSNLDALNPASPNLKKKFERVTDDAVASEGTPIGKPTTLVVNPESKSSGQANPAPYVQPSMPADDTLTAMTVTELKSLAEEEEIDLGGASKKEDIIKAIRKASTPTT